MASTELKVVASACPRRSESTTTVYRFTETQSLEKEFRRIAREQMLGAINVFDDPSIGTDEAIHEARKRCKMLRALLRLIRPAIGKTYARESNWFRLASRRLGDLRDNDAMLEAYNLFGLELDDVPSHLLEAVSDSLQSRAVITTECGCTPETRIAEFQADMQKALDRLPSWAWNGNSEKALAKGFRRTYRDGRQAGKLAHRLATDEALHRWRKRAKDHLYHSRLLRDRWNASVAGRIPRIRELTELLGDDHDLMVLRATIMEDPGFSTVRQSIGIGGLINYIDRRRRKMQRNAFKVGQRLYRQPPSKLTRDLIG